MVDMVVVQEAVVELSQGALDLLRKLEERGPQRMLKRTFRASKEAQQLVEVGKASYVERRRELCVICDGDVCYFPIRRRR